MLTGCRKSFARGEMAGWRLASAYTMWGVDSWSLRVLLNLCVGLTACGSDGEGTEEGPPQKPESYLGLTMPAQGFQIRSIGADIEPGEEREYCEVAQLPGAPIDEYYVSSMELA